MKLISSLYALITVALSVSTLAVEAQRLSEMNESQLLAVLASAQASNADMSKGVAKVTAPDIINNVYGVANPAGSKLAVIKEATDKLGIKPEEDSMGVWMDSSAGYGVDYYGMRPEVTAVARFSEDKVKDFGYFFLFPYEAESKDLANHRQAEFCGSLLQEMKDTGMMMSADSCSSRLFEAIGEYLGSFVDVRLIDDAADPSSGRFILVISVEPDGFTVADGIAAL